MNQDKPLMTVERMEELIGMPIVSRGPGYCRRANWVSVQGIRIEAGERLDGSLFIQGDAPAWRFGSEVRRGRPKSFYRENPTESFLAATMQRCPKQ